MQNDPEFAAEIESILDGVKKSDDWIESMTKAEGAELIGCGTVIDKDGNSSGWAVVCKTFDSSQKTLAKGKSSEEIMEDLREKRAEEKKEKERLEERRDKLDISVEANVEVKTESGKIQGREDAGDTLGIDLNVLA